jgi:hypothetical protein
LCCIISDFDTVKTAVATDLMSDVTYLLSGSATILYLINKIERFIFYSGHPIVLLNLKEQTVRFQSNTTRILVMVVWWWSFRPKHIVIFLNKVT